MIGWTISISLIGMIHLFLRALLSGKTDSAADRIFCSVAHASFHTDRPIPENMLSVSWWKHGPVEEPGVSDGGEVERQVSELACISSCSDCAQQQRAPLTSAETLSCSSNCIVSDSICGLFVFLSSWSEAEIPSQLYQNLYWLQNKMFPLFEVWMRWVCS